MKTVIATELQRKPLEIVRALEKGEGFFLTFRSKVIGTIYPVVDINSESVKLPKPP